MHMLHHQEYLTDQKCSVLRGEYDHFSDDIKQVFALYEVHDEVNEIWVLH